tara:strand:- start:1593 stop:2192 length:600 start_codon:yes stop_codon:yes gene_type:complete
MKIAFIGDSFCADTGAKTWPCIVKEKMDATQIWKGVQGANQYTILKHTKKIVHLNPDIIIFTHTDPYRLANRHDRPLGARPCQMHKDSDKIWKAGHDYYEQLMDFGYHEISHIALVNECNKITDKIKTIHLFSFSTNELGFRDYNWDINFPNSYNEKSLAQISYGYQTPDNDDGWKTLPNHMNYAGNKTVSDIVLDMLK